MGYDLHITRADTWTNSEDAPITREEWAIFVATYPLVVADPENGPDDFLIRGHPAGDVPLWWYRGRLHTKNPDDAAIKLLCDIARALAARVVGDEGELYG